ncbi:MAG: 2-C-methyl-D-erythritol 4-phosphate cytidylyltransferase [Streptococcaceae bacterium]|jgi:2-C-methyl-D-erythritol 4-phosphate cytidylyltransferase|nr:2-C-methyl-D-erythritol 4-phosphate cytidylyltransferase [Streptococcaceae bacterium]
MKYTLILLAAGEGRRMGIDKNKIFIKLHGIPIIKNVVKIFLDDQDCKHILLVTKKNEQNKIQILLNDLDNNKIKLITGGKERQNSVYNAIKALKDEKYVMIHDSVRAFITHEEIERLKQTLKNSKVALLGIPVNDTIKQVDINKNVTATIPRKELYQAQTPQAFHADILKKVQNKAYQEDFLGTDDVSLVEKFLPKEPIKMVMGSYENIKITTPIDLELGKEILKKRFRGSYEKSSID